MALFSSHSRIFTNGHLPTSPTTPTAFRPGEQSIHVLLLLQRSLLHNGFKYKNAVPQKKKQTNKCHITRLATHHHPSTTATFICPQDGRGRGRRLTTKQ